MKVDPKRPFVETKSAIDWARRPELLRNLFVLMRVCCPVVLSYLDTGFEPLCPGMDFLIAYCCLLLLLLPAIAKMCCSSLDPKKGCKTSTG